MWNRSVLTDSIKCKEIAAEAGDKCKVPDDYAI